jgi:hypothetical protein
MGSKDIGSTKGFRSVAWSISNTVEDALNNRIGTLKISSQPSGADVYIDGKNEVKLLLRFQLSGGNTISL